MRIFTNGKDQYYERLMQEKPNGNKRYGSPKFKYRYADLNCGYCSEINSCKRKLCPHIVDNIRDLVRDSEFMKAVLQADTCTTNQKYTLTYLKKHL